MLISKECFERGCSCYDDRVDKDPVEVVEREWVGLTDEEIKALYDKHATYQEYDAWESGWFDFARAIEAKLKEKNR